MLQYPVQLPPLSLSSKNAVPHKDFDYGRPKRLQKDSLVARPQPLSPLPIFTNLPSSPSTPLPRSPYLSSRHLHPTSLPIISDLIEDVLGPGDTVGEGLFLQGEPIRLVSNGALHHSHREPAQEFQVIKQLGTGSYAVVYLVQEVLSRPPASEDGHMSTIGLMDFDNKPAQIVYGRKYAIKCLSKANLDEEALALQMSEVRCLFFPSSSLVFFVGIWGPTHMSISFFRLPSISHCICIQISSLSIELLKLRPSCSSSSSMFQEKTFSIS